MITIRTLETPQEMEQAEQIQALVWPGSDMDVVPGHMMLTAAHNGGLVLGAYEGEKMVGMLFGFVGLYDTPNGQRPKHCSHQMGVLPDARDTGVGFALKRAQWQIVREQGLDLITWTYDPLLSRNAQLNIARVGAVCNTYLPNLYGEMRDGLNVGLASDRFQVDLWANTPRVERRLGDQVRSTANLHDFQPLYQVSRLAGLITPPDSLGAPADQSPALLAEIPADFLQLKSVDFALARAWRSFSRMVFENYFAAGYLVTDFIFDTSAGSPRSFYVLTRAE
jgi:predicted GNAT superfamily acetyltransferase